MKPRLLFTERGVIHTHRRFNLRGAAYTAGAVIAVLAAYGLAGTLDAGDEVQAMAPSEPLRIAAFEAGREAGRKEILLALEEGAIPRGGCAALTVAGERRP